MMRMARLRNLRVLCLILPPLPLVACGGDGPGATCGAVQPCGGDLVGDWSIVADCLSDATVSMSFAELLGASCPTVTGHASLAASGSVAFGADLGYMASGMISGVFEMQIPPSCFAGAMCADVDAAFRTEFAADPQPDLAFLSCGGTVDCICRFKVGPRSWSESGSYATSGTTVTVTSSLDGSMSGGAYCIVGDTGHLVTLGMSIDMGSIGSMTIDEDMVIVRR
jgi:hypothetical protein